MRERERERSKIVSKSMDEPFIKRTKEEKKNNRERLKKKRITR